MSFKLETELVVERLRCTTVVFWPKRMVSGGWICGFNLGSWCVQLRIRIVRWRENLHRGR